MADVNGAESIGAPRLPLLHPNGIKLHPSGRVASLLEGAFPALYPPAPPIEEKKLTQIESDQLPPIVPNPALEITATGQPQALVGKGAGQASLSRQGTAKQGKGAAEPSSRPTSKSGSKPGVQIQELTSAVIAADVSTEGAGQLASQNTAPVSSESVTPELGRTVSTRKRDGIYGERVAQIEGASKESVRHDTELIQYLDQQLGCSKELDANALLEDDALFTPEHRQTGLPMKPSQLVLDRGRLAQEGLLDPKEILEREREMEELAQMPPRTLEYLDVNAKGYLKMTSNLAVREKMTLGRATHAASSHKRARMTNGATADHTSQGTFTDHTLTASKSSGGRPGQLGRTRVERELERKMLEGLTGKMQYLPNPRYRADALTLKPVPSKAHATSVPGVELTVEPPSVEFTDYEAGKIYEQTLTIHNVSSISRRVRILPPSTGLFAVSLPHFPTSTGLIAPGMHCTATVFFAPTTLADVTDAVTVQSDLTSCRVAVYARRDPPVLTLPAVLDCGPCLVDHTSVMKFPFRNSGGPGSFQLSFASDGLGREEGIERWSRSAGEETGELGGTEPEGLSGTETEGLSGAEPKGLSGTEAEGLRRTEAGRLSGTEPQGLSGTEPETDLRNGETEGVSRMELEGDRDWKDPTEGEKRGLPADLPFARPELVTNLPTERASRVSVKTSEKVLAEQPAAVRWGPFTVSPAYFHLAHNEETVLTVTFNPRSEDPFLETLQLECDNCQSQTVTVEGRGAILDVHVAEIDGRAVQNGELQQGVWFEPTAPGAPLIRTITLENRTALDVPVRCELTPVPDELAELRGTFCDVKGADLLPSEKNERGFGSGETGRTCSGSSSGGTRSNRNDSSGRSVCEDESSQDAFRVSPAETVVGANSRAEVVVSFVPGYVNLFQAIARFGVDTKRVSFQGGADLGASLHSFGGGGKCG